MKISGFPEDFSSIGINGRNYEVVGGVADIDLADVGSVLKGFDHLTLKSQEEEEKKRKGK